MCKFNSILKFVILLTLISDTVIQHVISDEVAEVKSGTKALENETRNVVAVDVQVAVENIQSATGDGKGEKTVTPEEKPNDSNKPDETDPLDLSAEIKPPSPTENPETEVTTPKDITEKGHVDSEEHLNEPYEISIHHSKLEPGENPVKPEVDKNIASSMEEKTALEYVEENNSEDSESLTQPIPAVDQPEPNNGFDSNVMQGESSSSSQDQDLGTITTVLGAEEVDDSGDDCDQKRDPLKRLGFKSKFFVENTKLHNFREARELCSKFNLVIAEVEGLADHRTLESFTSQSNAGNRFFIGLNDIKTEGLFKHADGRNVTFQNFLASQPDDQNMTEDCVTMMKESKHGPAGAADYDCNKTAYVFCMFSRDSKCYSESYEGKDNQNLTENRALKLLINASKRTYHISNFQATWKEAMNYCAGKTMALFNMDNTISMTFFRELLKWEKEFISMPMSTVQYWTSGKFKKSHMSSPIIWHSKPELTESEERGVEKHNGSFSFSGLFNWSTKKQRDPGGPHGWRRDLCVSFGFDNNPYETPFTRNTNCDLPNYFICYKEISDESLIIELPEEPRNLTALPNHVDPNAPVIVEEHQNLTEQESGVDQIAPVSAEGNPNLTVQENNIDSNVPVVAEEHQSLSVPPIDIEHKAPVSSEGQQNLTVPQNIMDEKLDAKIND